MTLGFDRPTGARADVSELEYVSALMQTNVKELRANGSLNAEDISYYLSSRHAVDMTPDQVSKELLYDFVVAAGVHHEEKIMNSEGSIRNKKKKKKKAVPNNHTMNPNTNTDDDDHQQQQYNNNNNNNNNKNHDNFLVLDLVELVGILLIPRLQHEWRRQTMLTTTRCNDIPTTNLHEDNNEQLLDEELGDDEGITSSSIMDYDTTTSVATTTTRRKNGTGGGNGYTEVLLCSDSGDKEDDYEPCNSNLRFVQHAFHVLLHDALGLEENYYYCHDHHHQEGNNNNRKENNADDQNPHCHSINDNENNNNNNVGQAIELTPKILKRILMSLGESELAQQDDLIEEMIMAAATRTISNDDDNDQQRIIHQQPRSEEEDGDDDHDDHGREPKVRFTAETFLRALTHDLIYTTKVTRNNSSTSSPSSASDHHQQQQQEQPIGDRESSPSLLSWDRCAQEPSPSVWKCFLRMICCCWCSWCDGGGEDGQREWKQRPRAQYLDYTWDAFRSRPLAVLVWTAFVVSFFAIYYLQAASFAFRILPVCRGSIEFRSQWRDNLGTIGCQIGTEVLKWIYTVLVMGCYGTMYFACVAVGNGIDTTNPLLPFFGAGAAAFFTFFPTFQPLVTYSWVKTNEPLMSYYAS